MSIHISLSPNTEPDDVWQAIRTLLFFWRFEQAAAVAEVERVLAAQLGRPVAAVSSGRAALAAVLRASDIGAGSEVIVQAFTCVSVPAAVTWAGATPIFADITAHTYNLDPASVRARITPRTKAIVVQHTFGLPAAWEELQEIARQHQLLLIEDCAHAFGATYQGRLVGTLGDAAIFSFGRDKALSSVFGGAVAANNQAVLERIKKEQARLHYPPHWWVGQQLLHPILVPIIKRTYFTAALGKILLVGLQRFKVLSKAVTILERDLQSPAHVGWRYSPALAILLLRQLKKLSRFTAARRAVAQRYLAVLPSPAIPDGSQPNWLRFPLQVSDPAGALRRARAQRLILGDWYRQVIFPLNGSSRLYTPGSCPVAEATSARIINLPTGPLLTDTQVEKVLAFVRQENVL